MSQPFTIEVNLDVEPDCCDFLAEFEPARGRRLANLLGFKGRHSVRAADALMNYAQNKRAAFMCRKRGSIQTALQYEKICDRIYREDIQLLVQCW